MARIFISYKRADKDKVFKIKDQIESALGEKCWIDLDGIESDAVFKRVIIKAINECEIVLFMYSKTHCKIVDFEKDWTVRELNYAAVRNKRIVFVNLDASRLTDEFVFDYGMKQQVDGTNKESVAHLITDLVCWQQEQDIENRQNDSLIEKQEFHLPSFKNLLHRYSKNRIISAFILFLIALSIIVSFYLSKTRYVQAEESQCVSQLDSVQAPCFELAIPFADYDANYSAANSFHDGLARIRRNGKYGYIDKNGNEVIPCKFEDAEDFSCHRARVEEDGKFGYINKKGEFVIECNYNKAAMYFYENLVWVMKDGKYGFVDIFGKNVIPVSLNYDFVGDFSEGLVVVGRNHNYGYMNKLGQEVIPCSINHYPHANFSEGLALVDLGDAESAFIDQNGKIVISETDYFLVGNFIEGLAEVKVTDEWGEESKYGFIDKTGKLIIPCIYDRVGCFHDGLAYFEKEETAGFINKGGVQVITLTNFDKPLLSGEYYFREGFAVVEKDGKYGYINKAGEEATSFIYDDAYPVSEGYALVKLNGQYGYLKVVK